MDCQVIVARIIWASEARVRDDRLEQIVGDVSAFLERSLVDKPGAPVLLPRSF